MLKIIYSYVYNFGSYLHGSKIGLLKDPVADSFLKLFTSFSNLTSMALTVALNITCLTATSAASPLMDKYCLKWKYKLDS